MGNFEMVGYGRENARPVVIQLDIWVALIVMLFPAFLPARAAAEIDTLWTRRYGGGDFAVARDVKQVADGGFIIAGYDRGPLAEDLYLVRTDPNGNSVWSGRYGGSGSDGAYSVQVVPLGYMVAGMTSGLDDVWLLMCDDSGDTIWTRTYGQQGEGYCLRRTRDGGYVIAGHSGLWLGSDFLLIKTDPEGNMQWLRTYGGSDVDRAYAVAVADDGGYVLAGFGGDGFYYDMIKVDSLGEFVWGIHPDGYFYALDKTSDGGYIGAGTKEGVWGNFVLYLRKVDSDGSLQWQKSYGDSPDWSVANSVRQTPDGGYIVAGYTGNWYYEDLYVLKTDSLGNKEWDKSYSVSYGHAGAYAVEPTSDGCYIVAGYIDDDAWLLKIGEITSVEDDPDNSLPSSFGNLEIYPNPTNAIAKISYTVPQGFPQQAVGHPGEVILTIYNLLGQRMYEQTVMHQKPGRYSTSWDGSRYPSGIYLVRVKMGEMEETKRLLILK